MTNALVTAALLQDDHQWFDYSTPELNRGTGYSLANDAPRVRMLTFARIGFTTEPWGECLWTARDLR